MLWIVRFKRSFIKRKELYTMKMDKNRVIKNDRLYLSSDPYIRIDKDTEKWEVHSDYHDYLYRTISDRFPFHAYEHELKRLNDYIVFLLEKTKEETEEQISLHVDMEPDWVWIGTADIERTQSSIQSTWSFNRNKTLYLTAVTLSISFLESCLNDFVKLFVSEEKIQAKGVGNIEKYIIVLNEFWGSNILIPKYLNESRRLRNKFIHDQFNSSEIGEETVRYTIDAIVELLYDIKQEFINKEIIGS